MRPDEGSDERWKRVRTDLITMNRALLLLLSPLLFSACSFDSFFLLPQEIPRDTDSLCVYDPIADESFKAGVDEDLSPIFPKEKAPGYRIESTLFQSESGNELHGWSLLPPDSVEPNGITLFVLHGNAVNITKHFGLMKPFLQRGFKAFIFDYSGYGFSEGEARREHLLPDSRAAFEHVLGSEDFEGERFLFYGQSLGGHLAPTLALEYEERIEGLILEGGFSTPKAIAADKAGIFGRLLTGQDKTALASIPKWEKPVLIIHGTEDEVVPFEEGEKLYEAANEPKTFLEYEMGHLDGPVLHSEQIIQEMLKMIEDQ